MNYEKDKASSSNEIHIFKEDFSSTSFSAKSKYFEENPHTDDKTSLQLHQKEGDIYNGGMKINNLPDEILLFIFSFFDVISLSLKIALVCHKWYLLAHDPLLWKNLHFNKIRKEDDLFRIIIKSPFVENIHVQSALVSDWMLKTIAQFSKSLKKLTLEFCNINDVEGFHAIAKECSLLEYVNLEGSKLRNGNTLSSLAKMFNLKQLNLSHCHIVEVKVIAAIAKNCLFLENLNIDGVTLVFDDTIVPLIMHRKESLKHLILDGELLTDTSFKMLEKCQNLKELQISFSPEMSDESIPMIAKLSKLEILKIRKGNLLSAAALSSLFSNKKLPYLTHLNLGECQLIDDLTLESISQNCKLLLSLSLQWCWEVTDIGICSITINCNKLRVLDLIGVVRLSGSFIQYIKIHLPELCFLNLEQCSNIDDETLTSLAIEKPELKIFDYWGDIVRIKNENGTFTKIL